MTATKKTIRVNLTSGNFAVAITGRRGYRTDYACGNGITEALNTLVTRCETREEAEAICAALNDSQPSEKPGCMIDCHEVVAYRKTDYIGRQNRERGQTRDCDRQCAHTHGDVITIG